MAVAAADSWSLCVYSHKEDNSHAYLAFSFYVIWTPAMRVGMAELKIISHGHTGW